MSILTNLGNALQQGLRDVTLTDQEKQKVKENKKTLEIVKIASLVSAVALAIFFAAMPSIFTLAACLILAVGAKDIHTIADNALKIHDDPFKVKWFLGDDFPKSFAYDLGQDTLIAKPILHLLVTD